MEDTVEHKFRVALNKIKLINEKPINCTLKYNYLLFGATEKNTACSFIIGCNKEWQDIPATGYEEFLLPKTTKECGTLCHVFNLSTFLSRQNSSSECS